MNHKITIDQRGARINLGMVLLMIFFHLGAVAALFLFTWQALLIAILLWWITGGLGIGMGYHRLLTHRGFKVSRPMEYFLVICGSLALQGGTLPWVATHRVHHAFTDRDGDPHSPRDGRWWSHLGWILSGDSILSNHFTQHYSAAISRYVPDLAVRPFHVWLTRFHWLPLVMLALILFAVGGWPFVMWGIFLRVVFSWHATWLVNSATHIWGGRRFATSDDSRNLWWVALITFGEGWHNNHHAHPSSARHGLVWYELDINWCCIRALQWLGQAKDIRLVNATKLVPLGGTHPKTVPLKPSFPADKTGTF